MVQNDTVTTQQTKYPMVGAGLIIFNDKGQILMGHRLSKYGYGTWNNAGGKVEFGEDPKAAAIREAKEETNLTFTKATFLGYFNDEEVYEKGIVRHWVTLMFSSFCSNPEELVNLEPHKHSEWKWFDLDKLPFAMWTPMYDYWENSDEMHYFHTYLINYHGAKSLRRLSK